MKFDFETSRVDSILNKYGITCLSVQVSMTTAWVRYKVSNKESSSDNLKL